MVTYLAIAKLCKLRAQQWDCDGIRSTPTDPNTHPNLGNFESLNGEEVFDKRRGWSRASRRLREDTERSGVPDPPLTRRINQIANYTLVEWADNIDISDDPPTSYVPDYESKFTTSHGAQALADQYAAHALWSGWETASYSDFLVERRSHIAAVIRAAFDKI